MELIALNHGRSFYRTEVITTDDTVQKMGLNLSGTDSTPYGH